MHSVIENFLSYQQQHGTITIACCSCSAEFGHNVNYSRLTDVGDHVDYLCFLLCSDALCLEFDHIFARVHAKCIEMVKFLSSKLAQSTVVSPTLKTTAQEHLKHYISEVISHTAST